MADSITDLLREAHRLRKHIRELQTEIERGPRILKAHQDKLERQTKAVQGEQETIKHLKVTIHSLEITLKQTNTQLEKAKKQYEEATDQRQMDAKQHEIAHCETVINATEEDILTKMGELEDHVAKLPIVEAELAKGKADFQQYQMDAAERLKRLQTEKKSAEQELALVDAKWPDNVRPMLDRLVKAHGPDAFAEAKNRVCTHCQGELTQQLEAELLAKSFITCKSCGRALYFIS